MPIEVLRNSPPLSARERGAFLLLAIAAPEIIFINSALLQPGGPRLGVLLEDDERRYLLEVIQTSEDPLQREEDLAEKDRLRGLLHDIQLRFNEGRIA